MPVLAKRTCRRSDRRHRPDRSSSTSLPIRRVRRESTTSTTPTRSSVRGRVQGPVGRGSAGFRGGQRRVLRRSSRSARLFAGVRGCQGGLRGQPADHAHQRRAHRHELGPGSGSAGHGRCARTGNPDRGRDCGLWRIGIGIIRAYEAAGQPLPIISTTDDNSLSCGFADLKAANPAYELSTVSSRTWIGRVALRKAVAAFQGGSDQEPSLYELALVEDSTGCRRSDLPGRCLPARCAIRCDAVDAAVC